MKKIVKKTSFGELIAPIRKAVKAFYNLKRTKLSEFDYEQNGGYQTHCSVGAVSSIDQQLTAEGLAFHEERDRQPIDVILMMAFQLGYSQARFEMERVQNSREKLLKEIHEAT